MNDLLYDIPCITDERGALCVAEWAQLPFEPQRVFWISHVAAGKMRGGHAHSLCAELIFPVCGSFDIFVDDGSRQQTFHMDTPNRGILIRPNVWCELRNFTSDAVAVVLASCAYMRDGYINDYDDFKNR